MPCQRLLYIAEHWFCRGLKRTFLNMWSKLQGREGFPWGATLTSSAPLMLPTQSAVGVSSGKSAQMFLYGSARGWTTVLQPLLAPWLWFTLNVCSKTADSLWFLCALFAVPRICGLGLKKHNLCVGLEEREGSGSCSWSHGQGKTFFSFGLHHI